MLCKRFNKIDLVLFHIMFLLLSHTDTIIYCTNNGTLTCLCTLPVLGQYHASAGTGTGAVHCASTGPMQKHYYLSTGPIQLAGTGPAQGQYIAPALAQCWTSIGPTLGQYHMPALGRFTAAVQRMHWANAVYTGLPVLAQYWPNTLRQHWPNAGPALAQHWGSTTCQHWPDSQPLCSVCIGPMPFIPACQYWPSTGPILSCLLGR